MWAVEKVIPTIPTPERPPALPVQQGGGGQDAFAYHAMTPIPPHWHPYVVDNVGDRRRFVQGRAADLSGPTPTLLHPAPTTRLGPAGGP